MSEYDEASLRSFVRSIALGGPGSGPRPGQQNRLGTGAGPQMNNHRYVTKEGALTKAGAKEQTARFYKSSSAEAAKSSKAAHTATDKANKSGNATDHYHAAQAHSTALENHGTAAYHSNDKPATQLTHFVALKEHHAAVKERVKKANAAGFKGPMIL